MLGSVLSVKAMHCLSMYVGTVTETKDNAELIRLLEELLREKAQRDVLEVAFMSPPALFVE